MSGKYFKYTFWSACSLFLVCCNSQVNKQQHSFTNSSSQTIVKDSSKQRLPVNWVALDTIVGKDTIKMVIYGDTIIKCSLNQLADTLYNHYIITGSWDKKDIDAGALQSNTDKLILVPGSKKPRQFILNDTMLIISICDWKGRALLYLLNRTPNSICFAKKSEKNPVGAEGYYVYVDIKNDVIIDYGDRIHPGGDNGDGNIYAPYKIERFRIKNRRFVYSDCDTSFYKQFLKLDMDSLKDVRTFYEIIAHKENWKRNKYVDRYSIPIESNE